MPVYNAEEYVERCENSLIKQIDTNLEIIIVNDGSTDANKAICENLKSKDSQIVVVK